MSILYNIRKKKVYNIEVILVKKIAAFFDIDGTLYRDSLMVEHFKKLIRYEIIDQKVWLSHARDTFMNRDNRQGNYDDYLYEICDI